MSFFDADQTLIRKELQNRMKELVNLRCDGQSRKINIVPKYWHDSLINWIQDSSNPVPGPIDNSPLFLYNGEFDVTKVYKKDFMIVDSSIWTYLADIFTCKKPVTRKLSSHPITSCTVVLLSPIVIEIITFKGSIFKTCSADWLLGELRRPLCTALRYVFNEHTFASYDTNEIIDDKMSIGTYSNKYGTKIKLIEKDLNNKNVENAKNFKNSNKNSITSNRASKYSHLTFDSSPATKSTVSKICLNNDPSLSSIINDPTITKYASSTYQIKEPNPVGLINPGNTCFFNASIQCIIRIPQLYRHVLAPGFNVSINRHNPHGSGGVIANEFANFLISMSLSSTAVRDPRNLRHAIFTRYKEFANNNQQDAQEMVYAILDGLHEDLYRIQTNEENKTRDISPSNNRTMTSNLPGLQNKNNNFEGRNYKNDSIKLTNPSNHAGINENNHILKHDILSRYSTNKSTNHSGIEQNTSSNPPIHYNVSSNISNCTCNSRPASRMTPRSGPDPRKPSSIIEEIFFGQLRSQTLCPNCESVESVTDPFLFLSVPIPSSKTTIASKFDVELNSYFDGEPSENSVTLNDCIQLFLKSGQLDENNKWRCPHCNTNVCAYQTTEIKNVGDVLIIHLKRFESTANGSMKKIDTKVIYPPFFDIHDIAPNCKSKKYKLISVIFHSGSISQGHYTAAAIDPGSGKWYNFNDSYSAIISPKNIFSSRAYILFYMNVSE